jgi:hypothetical protein
VANNPIADVPRGYILPINAFGRIWGNDAGARTSLGYALQPEQGYTLTITSTNGLPTMFTMPNGQHITVQMQSYSWTN